MASVGDAEDRAVGDALEHEYDRANRSQKQTNTQNQAVEVPSIKRLIDDPSSNDIYEEYDEKPKRNGAYS